MKAQPGFTLIEVLIAMTLLGLIMVMLHQAMSLGAKSWDYGETTAVEVAQMRDVYGFIRKQINRIQPISRSRGLPQTKDEKPFVGEREYLRFIANLPNNIGIAGPVIHELQVEEGDQGTQILLKLKMDHPDAEWELTQDDDKVGYVLLSGVSEVAFEYFGAKNKGQNADWHDRWDEGEVLPKLIKIKITFPDDHAEWPEMTAKIKVDGESSGRGSSGRRGSFNRGDAAPGT